MKIQIDTSAKAIRLLEDVYIGELISTLKKLLPNNEYKEFTIQYAGEILWKDVIFVPWRADPPIYPWYNTKDITVKSSTTTTTPELINGIYNVETQQVD